MMTSPAPRTPNTRSQWWNDNGTMRRTDGRGNVRPRRTDERAECAATVRHPVTKRATSETFTADSVDDGIAWVNAWIAEHAA